MYLIKDYMYHSWVDNCVTKSFSHGHVIVASHLVTVTIRNYEKYMNFQKLPVADIKHSLAKYRHLLLIPTRVARS